MLGFAVLLGLFALCAGVPDCGKPAITPSTESAAIVGGTDATEGSWPWQVQVRKLSFGGQWCGGTLIDDQWVLSAAHCFHTIIGEPDENDYEFVLGGHHIDDEGQYYQKFTASNIICHEDYGSVTKKNDVALIKLSKPVTWSDGVSTACMRSTPPEVDTVAWVTGWGDQEKIWESSYLQQVNVPIVSEAVCEAAYSETAIDETMICAGYSGGGKDSCQGDSGGPLVFLDGDTWYVGGVVSWGEGCADAGKYGVYADVSQFQTWISDTKSAN